MKFFKLVVMSLLLTACSTSIEKYKNERPELVFEKFFSGKMIAHGFFKDRFNHVKKTFVVDMDTKWAGNVGTLTENFKYSDGTTSVRIWTLKIIDKNKIIGTASDVVGEAVGEIAGNTLHWVYDLDLKVDEKTYRVKFDDWMYLIDEHTLLNQSYMSKFGVDLGEVVLSIRKL